MQFQELGVIRARQVIVTGTNDGVFTYRSVPFSLASSDCGVATKDPLLGNNCPAGFATYNNFSAVTSLLSADKSSFILYRDLGSSTQGILLMSISSITTTDPVNGGTIEPGLFGQDPFGNAILVLGSTIKLFNALIPARNSISIAAAGTPSVNPYIRVDAPEQGNSGHMQMLLQASSPDGTQKSQAVIGEVGTNGLLIPFTNSMLEVQGNTGGAGNAVLQLMGTGAGQLIIAMRNPADTNNRLRQDFGGPANRFRFSAGPGNAVQDTVLYNDSASLWGSDDIAWNNAGAAEAWRLISALTYQNGWLDGTLAPAQYRREAAPQKSVSFTGSLKVPAGVVVGQTIAVLPAGFRPAAGHTQSFICRDITAGAVAAFLQLGSGGTLSWQGATAAVTAGDIIDIGEARIYLDA